MLTSTAASTGRRLGGLSRFGGPARRVIPPPDTEETDGDDRFSPVLIGRLNDHYQAKITSESPRHDGNARASTSSPGESSRSTSPDTTGRNQHHRQSPPRGLDPPPVILDIVEPRPLMTRTFRHEPSQASAVTAQRKLSTSSPPGMGDRPFRPFQSRHNQENEPEYDEAEASMARRLKTVAPRSVTDVLDRPPPQPLRPAHVVHRVLEPPPPSQRTPPLPQALVATRAPPVLEQGNVENRSLTQTAPLVPQSSQYPGPDLGQQAATLPTQVVPPGKRSFLVSL